MARGANAARQSHDHPRSKQDQPPSRSGAVFHGTRKEILT
jgi:hypothetical protein